MLKEVETGKLNHLDFMSNIEDMIKCIIRDCYNPKNNIAPIIKQDKGSNEILGSCPRCGNDIIETLKAFSCINTKNKTCSFILWKDNKYFQTFKKTISKPIAKSLVSKGEVFIKNLYSKKLNKNFAATIHLKDNGEGYPGFEMSFNKKKRAVD